MEQASRPFYEAGTRRRGTGLLARPNHGRRLPITGGHPLWNRRAARSTRRVPSAVGRVSSVRCSKPVAYARPVPAAEQASRSCYGVGTRRRGTGCLNLPLFQTAPPQGLSSTSNPVWQRSARLRSRYTDFAPPLAKRVSWIHFGNLQKTGRIIKERESN